MRDMTKSPLKMALRKKIPLEPHIHSRNVRNAP